MSSKELKRFLKAEVHCMRKMCAMLHISFSDWITNYAKWFRDTYTIRHLLYR